MNKKEFVYSIGEVVRFATDPEIKCIVTGVVLRAGGASFIVSDKGSEVEVCVEEIMKEEDWVPYAEDEGEVEA